MTKLKKRLLLGTSYVLTAALAIGGTLAYLTSTDDDVNVMTLGNVKIKQLEYERVDPETVGDEALVQKYTQNKDLYPAVYGDDSAWQPGWTQDDAHITWDQLGNEGSWNGIWDPATINNEVDKFVFVENTGWSDAYVRTWFAFELGDLSLEEWDEMIHLNINANHWDWDGDWSEEIIYGKRYAVKAVTYTRDGGVLEDGELSRPSLLQVALDKNVTNETLTSFGSNYDIKVFSEATQTNGFADAKSALVAAFGTDHPWTVDYKAVPDDAVAVTSEAELIAALANGGNIYIADSFEVTSVITTTVDAAIYADTDSYALSFAPAATVKVANGTKLAVYGLTVDNGEEYAFDAAGNLTLDKAARKTTAVFNVSAGGTLELGQATMIKAVTAKGTAAVYAKGTADNRATVVLEGATVMGCAGQTGAVINADNSADIYIEDGTAISGNFSYDNNNHGIIRVYSGSVLYVNGGELSGNRFSGNGMIGLWNASAEMNGGKIVENSYIDYSKAWIDNSKMNNGRYGLIYVHSNSYITMNGGEITDNTAKSIYDAPKANSNPVVTINGGTVKNNTYVSNGVKTNTLSRIDDTHNIYISAKADVEGDVVNYTTQTTEPASNYVK